MSLTKQAKTLNKSQIDAVRGYLRGRRNGLRNDTMFLLSVKAGLRAKEIANLKWNMVVDSDGEVGEFLNITNQASKGKSSGRAIFLHKDIKRNLVEMLDSGKIDVNNDYVIQSERSKSVSSQVVINFFHTLYKKLGIVGASSHSGRRTFITETSRKISSVGGSLRDIQYLAGHSNLQTTQRYIESDEESKKKVISII